MSGSYEVARDRWHYRFENPSTWEGDELVPHDYQQTYWGDNQWIAVRARYSVGGRLLESEAAFTPARTTRGDDFDRFFLPNGNVGTSGTTGDISLHSLRFEQKLMLGRTVGLEWNVGYRYRRDHADFHDGDKLVRLQTPDGRILREEWSITTDREQTISNVHEIQIGVRRQWTGSGPWRTQLALDAAPVANATLTTRLPDKYPGRDIRSTAIAAILRPSFTVSYGRRRAISVTTTYTRSVSYRGGTYHVDAFGVAVGVR